MPLAGQYVSGAENDDTSPEITGILYNRGKCFASLKIYKNKTSHTKTKRVK